MTVETFKDDAESHYVHGHICPKCGKRHRWGVWVFAHYWEELTHTCDCGQVVNMRGGIVYV